MQPGNYRVFVGIGLALLAIVWFMGSVYLQGKVPGMEFSTVALTDANWENGVHRADGRTILLNAADFASSDLLVGDFLQFPETGFREVLSVESQTPWIHVKLRDPIRPEDGAPKKAIHLRFPKK
jgi:hypothetical protein